VAQSLHNLGDLYRIEGRYSEAEPLYLRALAIREKILGKDHPDVAALLVSYAQLLRQTGLPTKAEDMELRAKQIRASDPNILQKMKLPYS